MATGGKARETGYLGTSHLLWGAIRGILGARGGHFDARIELINKVKSDLSGIMHRLYVLCSSDHYIDWYLPQKSTVGKA